MAYLTLSTKKNDGSYVTIDEVGLANEKQEDEATESFFSVTVYNTQRQKHDFILMCALQMYLLWIEKRLVFCS